jgi:hypothetical protein
MAELTDTKYEPEDDITLDEATAETAYENADFPDGGWRAWLVVFGVF